MNKETVEQLEQFGTIDIGVFYWMNEVKFQAGEEISDNVAEAVARKILFESDNIWHDINNFIREETTKAKERKYKYVVVSIADEWYEEKIGKVFNTYEEVEKYLKKYKLNDLIDKLKYLEGIKHSFSSDENNTVHLVISYC